MNLLLIGPRACGKTTIGLRLAERIGWTFIDLDDETLKAFPEPTIRDAWRAHGESAWRDAEVRVLGRVMAAKRQVIALGGGTPMIDEARKIIDDARRDRGAVTAYLKCSAEVLMQRLMESPGDRPSLTGGDVAAEVQSVLTARESVYEALADIVCPADHGSIEATVEAVLSQLRPDGLRAIDEN